MTLPAALPVRLLHPAARAPARTRPGDAGYDLRSVEAIELAPGGRHAVATGLALALPPGVAGLVTPRSGLAAEHGITCLNAPGLIDPNYRGEVRVVLHNAGGLALGWLCATAFRVAERDRRAIVIEGGMQNSGLALGIIAVTFNADLGMVIIASLWGIWHIVSGLTLAILWRMKDARLAR